MYKKFNLFFILFIIICISFIGNAQQQDIYKPIITNDNLLSATVFSIGNINTMDAELRDGRLHVSDSVHGVKNLRVLESMLVNRLKGYNGNEVMLYHVNDAGIKDSSKLVPVQSDGTWTYFYDVEFSEVIIDGFVGSYEITAYNLSVSDSLNFGQTFNASNATSLSVNVTDDASALSKYDYIETLNYIFWAKGDDNYNDSSENEYHGIAYGDVYFTNNGSKYNNGSRFGGTDDYIEYGIINESNIFVSIWIKSVDVAGSRGIFSKYDYGVNKRTWQIRENNGKIRVILSQDGTNLSKDYTSSLSISSNEIHKVAFTFCNGELKIYIDGILDTNPTKTTDNAITTLYNSNVPICIGTYLNNGNAENSFYGILDNAVIVSGCVNKTQQLISYIDHLQQLKIKTDSNSTWSTEWNSSADNPIQVPYTDGEFFNLLNFTVPDTVVQNGITIYDYSSTVQLDAIATVGYIEDITKITETAAAGTYTLNVTHAANNTGEGYINYTTANSVLLNADFWNAAVLTTDNPNASLSSTLPCFNISIGYVAAATEYYYLVEQDYFYPPTNIQTTSSQCCVNITWDAVPNADNYSVYELEDGFPYVNTNPIIDGIKDTVYDYAHEFLIFSPNPITHGDYGTIYPVRTALGAYLLIESIDNDDKSGDDDTIYYFDLDNDGLTINDPAWKITDNIVKKYLWNGNLWAVTGSTNAIGDSTGGGTHYPIHELFIPVAELGANWINGSTIKVLVKREDSALSPDVITWYPYGNINNTNTNLWQEMVLNDPDSYIFLANITNLWYNATGLTPFTIYHGSVTAWNGTQETDYGLFDVITEDIQYYNVSGYIFDEDNNTLSNVIVYSCNGFVHEITQSDIYGHWIGYNFREGNYTICANKSGYAENSIDIYVSSNMINQNITLTQIPFTSWEIYLKLLELEKQNNKILLNMSINNIIVNDKIDTILIFILLNMAVIVGVIIGKRGKDNDN